MKEKREEKGERGKDRRAAHASPLSPLTALAQPSCELCSSEGGALLWRDERCRVVLVDDADYPGYCRVIWGAHVREMTDLTADERTHCMHVVFAVERALRDVLAADKINLASLGNQAPHVHWHVIPRFADDPHFPQPIWGARQRAVHRALRAGLAPRLSEAIAARL